jgi:hypothetical protein
MKGAIPPLLLYTFTACTGTIFEAFSARGACTTFLWFLAIAVFD